MKLFKRSPKAVAPENKQQLTRTESLACVPVRSESITWTTDDEGEVTVEYPITIKPFFLALAKRFNLGEDQKLTKKLQLDATGSNVWQMLDDQKDVRSIIKEVALETGLTLQEAELSVTTFLRELGRRGVILFK